MIIQLSVKNTQRKDVRTPLISYTHISGMGAGPEVAVKISLMECHLYFSLSHSMRGVDTLLAPVL